MGARLSHLCCHSAIVPGFTRSVVRAQHNDTPYQQLMQRGFPEFGFGPDDMPPLGLQCNMCIDEYAEANGGTMFVPDSYKLGKKPQIAQAEYKENTYKPPHAQCLTAPAGSVFCYHAATWHRMQPNITTSARLGLLQSFTPDFTVPEHAELWAADATPNEVDARERLASWLEEQVSPEMLRSYEWLAGGAVDQTLTQREARDVASLWVGEGGGAGRSTAKAVAEGSAGSIDQFGRVQQQPKL
jgi:ectoine hydroxylase-related dioxygenase (phytanoyl-CoA dioxygenase family)